MSSFDEIRSGLLKKYNVSAAGTSGSTNAQTAGAQEMQPNTATSDFYTIRSNLMDKYSDERTVERRNSVSDWGTRFNNVMQGITNPNSKSGSWYTRGAIDRFGREINSLILDYDKIRNYADKLGIPNAQRYLQQLQEVQHQIQLEDGWYQKYSGSGNNEVESALSAMAAGDERSWLEQNRYKVAPDYEELSKRGLSDYQKDLDDAIYEQQLQNWINQMAEAPLQDATPQYYQTLQQYRQDTSYKEMNDRWSEEQRRDFGYLYARDPRKAEEYAISVNDRLNAQAKDEKRRAVQEKAASDVKTGLKETGRAIAAGMLGIGEYMNDVAEYAARGRITEKGSQLSPVEYSNAVTGGIAQKLNEKYGTIDEDVFILGGKGLGDVYSLGTSVAQSMASGHLLGSTGTLLAFFGNAAASGIDDAKRRGATDEQAVALGTLQGIAEGLAEKIGVDNLFKRGAANTIRGFLKNAFAQAGSEGIEEGLTSLFNNISENIVMGENSQFYDRVNGYIENGMDDRSAKKKAWLDCVEDILFDSVAGVASGGVSGSIETGIQNVVNPVERTSETADNATFKESLTTENEDTEENLATDLPISEESSAAVAENATAEEGAENAHSSEPVAAEALSQKYGQQEEDVRNNYSDGQSQREAAYNLGRAAADNVNAGVEVMNAIPIAGLLYEKSKRDRLYSAIVAKDKAYVDRLKAGYETDESYHSAIKLALRDYDSRIWEAAVAWNNNDLKGYMALAREIIAEGNFIQDDVVLAIRAEASSMEESQSASSSTVKGYFTNEKFAVALSQNNTAMADIIRKDLIDTKVANGKTRSEAEKSVESTARSQLKELFETGSISASVAEKMLVKYGGYEQYDASEKISAWKYETDHPELDGRITFSQYQRWEADGKSRGISLEVYTNVVEYRGGDTSSGTRSQEDVAAYINSMPISTAQKDALWCCFWSESTLYKKAPWH